MNLLNMKRWIVASAIKALKTKAGGEKLFYEGQDIPFSELNSWLEMRIDGPYVKPQAGNSACIYIEINVMSHSKRDEGNAFKKENMQGIMAQMLNRDFCVYRIGNVGSNIEDDESLVGVMQLLSSDQIKTSDFGKTDDTAEVYESTAEAHYEMYL